MIFKDDFLHSSYNWVNPECSCDQTGDRSLCADEDGKPLEQEGDCISDNAPECANPYFKSKSECWPYVGPRTPQNNKSALSQSGIQFLSRSGHTLIFDDRVDQPEVEDMIWKVNQQPFSYGCTDTYLGKIKIISSTGYRFEINEKEDEPGNRGPENYLRLSSPCGNYFELNDHTVGKTAAGEKRGVWAGSTSGHKFIMCDEENEQASPDRTEINKPNVEETDDVDPTTRAQSRARKAYVHIRSGYGLRIEMNDENSQEKTQAQNIQIISPQTDNTERGPHLIRLQETPSGPGQVTIRVGGDYHINTYDNHYTIVGSEDNPSDKITVVSKNTYHQSDINYINRSELALHIAEDKIFLIAGQDCPIPEGGNPEQIVEEALKGPCTFPVLCYQPGPPGQSGKVLISDRVYVSSSPESVLPSIFDLSPFKE
jgi:hypothetical protein